MKCVIALSIVFVLSLPNNASADNTEQLSVKETLGAIMGGAGEGWDAFHVYRGANANARTSIYLILKDARLTEYQQRALHVLGYIGTSEDATNLIRIIEQYHGTLSGAEKGRMEAAMQALGTMTSRGIAEAENGLKAMRSPEYWEKLNVKWFRDEVMAQNPQLRYAPLCTSVVAAAAMGHGDPRTLSEYTMSKIDLRSASEATKGYLESRIGLKWLTDVANEFIAAEAKPITEKDRQRLVARYMETQSLLSDILPDSKGGADVLSDLANIEYLPIRESLIPMFAYGQLFQGNYFHEEHFPMNRINPAAQKYICYYLAEAMKSEERLPRTEGIWLLGFVGDEKAQLFLGEYMQWALKSTGLAQWNRANVFGGLMGSCTGMMVRRKVKGANEFLRLYADYQTWRPASPETTSAEIATLSRAYDCFLGGAYQYSVDESIPPSFQKEYPGGVKSYYDDKTIAILKSRGPLYTKLMQPPTVAEDKLAFYYQKCLEIWGGQIDALIAKADGLPQPVQVATEKAETAPGAPAGAQGARGRLPQGDIALVIQIVAEAAAEYEAIQTGVRNEKSLTMAGRLLNNGKPLDMDMIERLKAEFEEDFGREREVLGSLNGRKIVQQDFEVHQASTYKFARLDELRIGTAEKTADLIVTFHLGGSEDIVSGNPNLAVLRGRSLTVAEDGRLIVVMKKIDGEWYWNPFGW